MNDYVDYLRNAPDDEERAFRRKRLLAYQRAGVPEIYRMRSLNGLEAQTPHQATAIATCLEFLYGRKGVIDDNLEARIERGDHRTLLLIGLPGTGKTLLASALLTTASLDEHYEVALTTPAKLLRRLRATWERGARETETDVLREMAALDLLVLDDVGTGWSTESAAMQIGELIDDRYCAARPTIVTSNLDVDGLRRELGDRSIDRLTHGALLLPLLGTSQRRPQEAAQASGHHVVTLPAPKSRTPRTRAPAADTAAS